MGWRAVAPVTHWYVCPEQVQIAAKLRWALADELVSRGVENGDLEHRDERIGLLTRHAEDVPRVWQPPRSPEVLRLPNQAATRVPGN